MQKGLVALALATPVAVQALFYRQLLPIEDACIFLRYANNLVRFGTVVYNRGGPVVEGATSLPFLFLLSLLRSVHVPLLVTPAAADLFALVLSVGVLAWFLAQRCASPGSVAICMVALVASGVAPLSMEGFDAPVDFLFSISAAVMLTRAADASRRECVVFGGVCLALCVLRPDTLVLGVGALLGFALLRRDRLRWQIPCACAVATVLYQFARWHTFGYLLPNAFYVKREGQLFHFGLWAGTMKGFLLTEWIPGVAMGAVLLARLLSGQWTRTASWLVIGILGLGQWVLINNEMNHHFRYQCASLPWFLIPGVDGVECLMGRLGVRGRRWIGAAMILAAALNLSVYWHRRDTDAYLVREERRNYGLGQALVALEESGQMARDTHLLSGEAGTVPLISDLPSLDFRGLNDVWIAHHGFDERYLSTWNPQLLYFFRDPQMPLKGWVAAVSTIEQWVSRRGYRKVLDVPSENDPRASFELWADPNASWFPALNSKLNEIGLQTAAPTRSLQQI